MADLIVYTSLKQIGSASRVVGNPSSRPLVFLLLAFVFLLHLHLTCMIKTEAVVFKRPQTVNTYRDVKGSGRRPCFPLATSAIKDFTGSPAGSIERDILEAAKLDQPQAVDTMSINYTTYNLIGVANRKVVIFSSERTNRKLMRDGCSLSMGYGLNASFWNSVDPRAKVSLRGFVRNPRLAAQVARIVSQGMVRIWEHALTPPLDQKERAAGASSATSSATLSAMQACMSSLIVYPDHELIAPRNIDHYVSLLQIVVPVLMTSASIVLCMEKIASRFGIIRV